MVEFVVEPPVVAAAADKVHQRLGMGRVGLHCSHACGRSIES